MVPYTNGIRKQLQIHWLSVIDYFSFVFFCNGQNKLEIKSRVDWKLYASAEILMLIIHFQLKNGRRASAIKMAPKSSKKP